MWDETCAAIEHLQQSIDLVRKVERAALRQQQASICSEGITNTLALMEDSLQRMRARTHAADAQLTAAVDAVIAETLIEQGSN